VIDVQLRAEPPLSREFRPDSGRGKPAIDPKRHAATVGYRAGALISLMVAFARSYAT